MTQTIALTVPAVLRGELGTRELSRAALAKKIGKSDDWVIRRLRGKTEITLGDLEEMCRGLELEPVIELRPAPAPKKTTPGGSSRRRSRTPNPPAMEGSGQ